MSRFFKSPLALAVFSNIIFPILRFSAEKSWEIHMTAQPSWWTSVPWDLITCGLLAFLAGTIAQAAFYPRSDLRIWLKNRRRRFRLHGAAAIWGASGEAADLCELVAFVKFLKPCKQATIAVVAHHPHQSPLNGRQTIVVAAKDYIEGEELRVVLATIPRFDHLHGYVGREPDNPPILSHGLGYMLRMMLVINGRAVQTESIFIDLLTKDSSTSGRFYFLANLSAPIKFIAWETPPYDEPTPGA
jgi:hypothetical protein